MGWFDKLKSTLDESAVPEREICGVRLHVGKRETYIENPDEPGCFRKRVFWEASASPSYPYRDYWSVIGEGETRNRAIVACVEAMLGPV